jgi:hypothetical protein
MTAETHANQSQVEPRIMLEAQVVLLVGGLGSELSGLRTDLGFSSAVLNRRVGREDGGGAEYIHVQKSQNSKVCKGIVFNDVCHGVARCFIIKPTLILIFRRSKL